MGKQWNALDDPWRYQAYLLRLWREPHDDKWRVSLQSPESETRTAFSDIPAFVAFLETITTREPRAN